MADVVTKAIDSNDIKNGNAVTSGPSGNIRSKDRDIISNPSLSGVLNKYDTKFDDTNFYTA